MSDEDLKREFEKLKADIKSISRGGNGFLLMIIILYLNGCFKGCGY